jgi:hypothetical protein
MVSRKWGSYRLVLEEESRLDKYRSYGSRRRGLRLYNRAS